MYRGFRSVPIGVAACVGLMLMLAAAGPAAEANGSPKTSWRTDYSRAMDLAKEQGKMLVVFFFDPHKNKLSERFETKTLDHPTVEEKLRDFVCVRLALDTKIVVQGKQQTLLKHKAFAEMLGKPGVAILDFTRPEDKNYGHVVSTFPLTVNLWYGPKQMQVILDLPPGTLTQRTLIYAVRTHPDRPASTDGEIDENLLKEAESHSSYQARIRLQGHHRWAARFPRINALLPRGLTAREVCAESWPGENLVEAAIDCVHCWRLSSGHWSAVSARQGCYGYDMKRGRNGIWYATGIFGGR